jgi:hypothetical protein
MITFKLMKQLVKISKEDIGKIKSPLDNLQMSGVKDD